MKKQKTAMRTIAAMAKRRLSDGFWKQSHKKANLENINNPNCEDEIFYRKVCDILQRDSDANLLGMILDHEYMAGLDEIAHQRYVLTMSVRVKNSIARYNKVC